MSYPDLDYTTETIRDTDADALVLALPPLGGDSPPDLDTWPGVKASLDAIGFTGAPGAAVRVHLPEITDLPVAVVGTGSEPGDDALRNAIGIAVRTLTGFSSVAVAAPFSEPRRWAALAEGAALGGYRFDGYKSKAPAARADRVVVHGSADVSEADVDRVRATAAAVALVKDLVNIPAEWLGPADFAARAEQLVADLPVSVEIFDENALRDGGFGGILGVGQGSDRPPRLVRLDYRPAQAQRHVALVGKGITFDTGGLSLKPPAGMVGMKYDMCGAATALAVLRAVATIGAPIGVTAWLCIADNMPSGRATRPGDVLRMADGTSVEVLNTDAEGRLVLADGLVAASREHPDLIIDIATLTGAISVALGNRHTGVMGDDAAVAEYLTAAAEVSEPAWQLPLPDHMVEELDSPIADLQNAKIGDPAGGSLFAGLFLRHFVGRATDDPDADRIPWVHLDIAGSGMHKGAPYGFTDKGPTGTTVRSLVHLLTGSAN